MDENDQEGQKMKILVLGATGRTGRLILEKAVNDNHEVTAIVRDPSKINRTGSKIIQGTPYDADTVSAAMDNCEALICTLNVSRVSDNPWARLSAPKDMISRSIQNSLEAMTVHGTKRIISLSTLGAGDSWNKMPFILKFFVTVSNLRIAFRDHTRQEELIARSDRDWTVIRLPMLTDEKGEFETLVNNNDGVRLNKEINRESVARFVLSALREEKYYKKIIGISRK